MKVKSLIIGIILIAFIVVTVVNERDNKRPNVESQTDISQTDTSKIDMAATPVALITTSTKAIVTDTLIIKEPELTIVDSDIDSDIDNGVDDQTLTVNGVIDNEVIELKKIDEKAVEAKLEEGAERALNQKKVDELCSKTGNKLGSVTVDDCNNQSLLASGYWSDQGHALAYKNYLPVVGKRVLGKVLVIGGIHADEYSAISIMFKWMKILDQHHSGIIHWKFIPVSNPDGLFQNPATRQNGNGVDLNRNFPSADWNQLALKYWKEKAYSSPRRYPGKHASSETETQWLIKVIDDFEPDIVVSVHAPYELLDYDGPGNPPVKIGDLYLSQLGVFPGSLGNYGGIDLAKPIVTLELPSAGSLPPPNEITMMWTDLVRWLINKLNTLN